MGFNSGLKGLSKETMALGLTHSLTEMSSRNISWGGKGGRYVGLTTLPPSCANCLEIWEPQPPGILTTCPGVAVPLLRITNIQTRTAFPNDDTNKCFIHFLYLYVVHIHAK
jgi:hypothetical protein